MKVFFKTFGCRTNIYDSELMKSYFSQDEICQNENDAEFVVVNSCTVTNGADKDTKNYINHARNLGKKVILAGCGVQNNATNLYKNNSVFGVFGAQNKSNLVNLISSNERFFDLGNINHKENAILKSYLNHSKAFIKIQEGCDFRCSYCIIPKVRGKSRSLDENLIINQANLLAQNGFSEIVLTGTNIGSYGKDTNSNLGILLQKLGKIDKIKRIRLGSIEPSQIDDSFREILGEAWLERHLHIALQHTSQKMLNIMQRRNKAFRDIELFCELSDLGFALGSDFIVGHPGESEQIWEEAVENFKKFPLTHLHCFVYSPRKDTISANLDDKIEPKIAKERLKMLKNIVSINNFKFRQKQSNLEVLVETKGKDGLYSGFDQYYNKIKIQTNENLHKKWVNLQKYEVKFDENYAEI